MYKMIILLSSLFLVLSCAKEENETPITKTVFYNSSRSIVTNESFEFGAVTTKLSSQFDFVLNQAAYVQSGPCESVSNGYLHIGCLAPLTFIDSIELERNYELDFVDTVFNFSAKYPINPKLTEIGIQVDYLKGGKSDIYFNNLRLVNNLSYEILDGSTLNIYINSDKKYFEAFVNDEDVSDLFYLEYFETTENFIEFKVLNTVNWLNGVPYVQYNGMSIDNLETYTLKK